MQRLLPIVCLSMVFVLGLADSGHASDVRPLNIYFLDMMGGAATLIVTPLGESVLIDTGWLEPADRDAKRIYAAACDAGLRKIDYLVTSHFHADHWGGTLTLSKLIPIKKFLDKGHQPQPGEPDAVECKKTLYPRYLKATAGKTVTVKAGDDIPIKNDPRGLIPRLWLHCVAAERQIEGFNGDVDTAAPGEEMRTPDLGENARSIVLVLHYGKFAFYAAGDLTWNVEYHLAKPNNVVGHVDVYQITHHGLDLSNNPVLLKALSPTVCIAMNGPNKGVEPNTFRAMKRLPSVKAIYQIHYNPQFGDEGNSPLEFIANGKDSTKGQYIKVSVGPDTDRFTVAIGKDGPQRTYPVK